MIATGCKIRWIRGCILSVSLDESFRIDHIEDRNDNRKPWVQDLMFAGVTLLSFFIWRLFLIAAGLVAVICALVWIRRPLARRAIRRELPTEATDQEVEAKVKSSQRAFGFKVWFFVFCLPMLIILALMVANNMSVRFH